MSNICQNNICNFGRCKYMVLLEQLSYSSGVKGRLYRIVSQNSKMVTNPQLM